MEYKGFVKKVFEKGGRYSLLCNDDQWYGNARIKPPCEDNDLVKFEYEDNGKYHNIVAGTIKRKDNPNPPVEYEGKKGGGGGGKGSSFQADKAAREAYWAKKDIDDIAKQKVISFNGAVNTATAIVGAAVQHELITLKGKAGAKYEAFFALVMEEAETIFRVLQRVPENYDAIMGGDPAPAKEEDTSDILPTEGEPASDDWDDGEDDAW